MEHRLQQRLQVSADYLLGDAVGNRGDTQRSRPAGRLRNVHPAHRWRHIAARRQPIPELVEVIGEPTLELLDRLPVHSSRSLVGLHTLEGLPDLPLRDVERLCLDQRLLPSPVGRLPRLNTTAPSVQRHYSAFNPTTGCSAPVPRIGTQGLAGIARSARSLRIGATGSHVPCKSLIQIHAAFEPDAA